MPGAGRAWAPTPSTAWWITAAKSTATPGLFVADAAALPAAVGTPPSLAIAAWAHHVADRLADTIARRPNLTAVEPSTEGAH